MTELHIPVYTDGACSGNPGPGGWAYWMQDKLYGGGDPWTTNNEMELTAILEAVRAAPENANLVICTDSQNCINWISHRGVTIEGDVLRHLVQQVWEVGKAKHLKATFFKVKGHSGDKYNTLVDHEATAQARLAAEIDKRPPF